MVEEKVLSEQEKEEKEKKEQKRIDLEHAWLDNINKTAQENAARLEPILQCKIVPMVFVVEPLKDAAIAYVKKPNAKQGMKIFRTMGEDFDTGVELTVRSQLVRVDDLKGKINEELKEVSDLRFMDVNGKYDELNESELNLSLLFKMQTFISPIQDQFKKK